MQQTYRKLVRIGIWQPRRSMFVCTFFIGDRMNENILNKLINLSKKSLKKNEIAVAAIVEKNNKIISYAYNKRMKNKDVTAHAEIIAIRKAEKKIKDWRLDGYNMYVTLKPCKMCEEVIKESRIDKCYYIIDKPDNKQTNSRTNICYLQTNKDGVIKSIFQKSFKKLR